METTRPNRPNPVPPNIDTPMRQEIGKQLHEKMELSKGVYLGDIDDMMKTVEKQMPIIENDQIYLWELEKQGKIYLIFMILGLMMIALGVLI